MQSCKQSTDDFKMPGMTEVVCQHKSSAVQSGFGLCKNCYLEFCGGLDGLEPPAFQRAEMKRLEIESAETSESCIEPRKNDNSNVWKAIETTPYSFKFF